MDDTLESPPPLDQSKIIDYDHESTPNNHPSITTTIQPPSDDHPITNDETTFESISLGLEIIHINHDQIQSETPEELTPEDSEEKQVSPSSTSTNPISSPPSTVQLSPSPSSLPLPDPIPDPTPDPITPTDPLLQFAKDSLINSKKVPSNLPKIISMTRQRDLPPKSKEEEKKHLKELNEMKLASTSLDKRRKSETEAISLAKGVKLAASLSIWETNILPNWRSALRDDALRELWWQGTMPVRYRGRLWGMTIGNGLAVSRSQFASSLKQATSLKESNLYPEEILERMEEDIKETMPILKLFQKEGALYDDLKDVLLAYSVFGDINPHYPIGISYPAAMLLINMSAAEAFLSLVNLVEKSFLKSFYSEASAEREAYYRIFDTLLADTMPKVYANFCHLDSPPPTSSPPPQTTRNEVISPKLYLLPWLNNLFIKYLSIDLATRIFDIFLLEGDSFLFRLALVILSILEPRLFNPVLKDLLAVFEGEDRGAVAIMRREEGGEGGGGVERVYEVMGCEEGSIFRVLEGLEWKEETWERLVARELPEAD